MEQLADCQVELEQTKAKLTTIKADHIKQHRMNQKQIHDLRDRISKSEVCHIPLKKLLCNDNYNLYRLKGVKKMKKIQSMFYNICDSRG